MSSRERTAIEVTVLTDAMHLAGCYDQINGPALASMETLSLRLAQLIEAYAAGDPQKPNWSGVKYFQHSTGPLNLVPKVLRTHAHRLAKEEVEIENMRLRAAGVRGVVQDVVADGALPSAPEKDPKGGGKGKQRQLQGGGAAAQARLEMTPSDAPPPTE